MKKLLSILIFVLVPMFALAWGEWNGSLTAEATVKTPGGGVIVNQSSTPSGEYSTNDKDSKTQQNIGLSGKLYATFYFHAKAENGYVFTGWYTNEGGSNLKSALNPYSEKLTASIISTSKQAIYYAFFRQILTTSFDEVVLYLYDDGSFSTFQLPVTLNKTTTLSITDDSKGLLSISRDKESLSGSEDEKVTINITISEGQYSEVGDNKFNITLTPSNSSLTNENTYNPQAKTISVSIVRVATITFNPPTEGGSYTYYQDNGEGQTIPVDEIKTATVQGKSNDSKFTLSATPADGYRFRRWVIQKSTGTNEYLYDQTVNGHLIMITSTVTAEFIRDGYAQFIVLPNKDKLYFHMDDAFDAAKQLGKYVVSVYQPGHITIKTNKDGVATSFTKVMEKSEWLLPKPAEGVYTIPAGYTLLVPGLEKSCFSGSANATGEVKYLGYTHLVSKPDDTHFVEVSLNPQPICKLVVESGTTINVDGKISVYSAPSAVMGYSGRPVGYGQIHLQDGSHIKLNDGSTLHVMGYITGNPETSSVIAHSGSRVYEAFQIADWRGGTGMSGGSITNFLLNPDATLINNAKEVFPVGQYYVQSIETKLVMEHGAKEFLSTAVDVSSPFPVTAEFVTEMTDGEDLGLFALGQGTIFEKYYDYNTDRLKLKVVGSGNDAQAELSYMYLEVKVNVVLTDVDVSLDSRKYVLPINNNIDVTIDNVKMDVPYKCAFMAGSSLTVTNTAQLNIKNEVYLYDAELNIQPQFTQTTETNDKGVTTITNYGGYYYSNSVALKPLLYTAYHGKAPGKRTAEHERYPKNLTDATFVIDGKLTMENSGALYTTTYSTDINSIDENRKTEEWLEKDFGANITSNGGGVVNFQSVGSPKTTNQISQTGTSPTFVTNIPVCNAWLRNLDGLRSGGTNVAEGDTYMYVNGVWVIPNADLRVPNGVQLFTITLPNDENKTVKDIVCEVVENGVPITGVSASIDGNTDRFNVADPSFSDNRSTLTIPVTYNHTGVHGAEYESKVVVTITYNDPLTNESKTKNVEISLKATEDYAPKFSVTVDGNSFTSGSTLSMSAVAGSSATSTISIIPDANNVAQSLVSWSYSELQAPFTFDAKGKVVTYSPAESGNNTSTLTMTATYTDAGQNPISTIFTINLHGTATKQDNNLELKAGVAGATLFQTQFIDDIFADLGNGNPISFTYDEQLVKIESIEGNYRLTALENSDVVEVKTVVITATQAATDVVFEKSIEFTVTICPPAAWNWGKLYFNSTATDPVTTMNTVDWALDVTSVTPDGGPSISLDDENDYAATIGAPTGDADTYTATFTFTQGNYTKEFTSTIYADPRILPYCVDTERTYNDVVITKTNVTFGDATDVITFEPAAVLELEMKGVPNTLTFTPSGDNAWQVQERASLDGQWNVVVPSTRTLQGEQVVRLKPTTRYVQIRYAANTVNAGTITDLCISKLDIAADVDVLYLPIGKEKQIVLTHTAATAPTITCDLFVSEPVTETHLGTDAEPYYTTKVTVSGATEQNDYAFTAVQGNCTTNVVVRAYTFPQELPIKWADDVAERYYFETVDSHYAKWNAADKTLLLQTSNADVARDVTFAFNGAPSLISFNVSQSLATGGTWTISESANGENYSIPVSVEVVATDDGKYNVRYDGLHYTTRYVRVSYTPTLTKEGAISNLVIEGEPMAIVSPEKLFFSEESPIKSFVLTAINLKKIRVELDNEEYAMTHGESIDENTVIEATNIELSAENNDYLDALGVNKVGDIRFWVEWKNTGKVNQGNINIYNDETSALLATVKIVGSKNTITLDDETKKALTGISTGISTNYNLEVKQGEISPNYQYHEVDIANAFTTDGKALFDYLIIYGETKTTDGIPAIKLPTQSEGSNALTPYYIYRKAQSSDDSYQFVELVENANTPDKATISGFTTTEEGLFPTKYIDVRGSLSVYITGFCPYATTGQDKAQEGVWFFRGENGDTLDVYLEDCHIYSRNKTALGNSMNKEDEEAPIFDEGYARGSGGVLVFENTERWDKSSTKTPFVVNVHTIGRNTLKSNFGCFFSLFNDVMRAYQISAPLHIHMNSHYHVHDSRTELTLDDVWPTELNASGAVSASERTNGFLSLQKQSNNAPSIDLGNPHSVVNFRGGQVELENAQIVSPNYKTTLAISYRSGEFGGDNVGIKLAYGIGTDSVGGTVNFYDGTTTVLPMEVDAKYRQYYLMDTEPVIGEDGNPVVDSEGNPVLRELTTTSCLRTPKNTIVHGGSQCFMRACSHVTSKGGAPKDWMGNLLGQYVYGQRENETYTTNERDLVTSMLFPGCVSGLSEYYGDTKPRWNSITPLDGKLYFWIPDGYGGVDAEEDKKLTAWKACMTEIESGYEHLSGSIGGDTYIDPTGEEVANFLYCQIDQNIHDVITAGGTEDEFGNVENSTYRAPVKVPKAAEGLAEGSYMSLSPTFVGKDLAYQVETESEYTITDKVYYITTATADVWMTFTAPFDVARIWVVETYDEATLKETPIKTVIEEGETVELTKRESVLLEQAKHNADFASFFGVAMALGSTDDFETIFNDWKEWGIAEDKKAPEGGTVLYSGTGEYTLRGKYELKPYNGSNWNEANFYLNRNAAPWGYSYIPETDEEDAKEIFNSQWETPTATNGVLLEKGETYSMLFPYCVGCWEEDRNNNTLDREYWDYWSGKFLIFESTDGIVEDENGIVVKRSPHKIEGEEYLTAEVFAGDESLQGQAYLRGNSTFAFLETTKPNVLSYMPYIGGKETFVSEGSSTREILPTQSFLLIPPTMEQQVLSVSRMGKIKYRPTSEDNDDDVTTGGEHVPTINGGSDIFVTSVAEGINIAVSEPQAVGVFSATGQLIYSGWVDTSVNVNLVVDGVYVVVGENNSVKIIY